MAFIAPGNLHMKVVKEGNRHIIKCYPGEKVSGHCPSVDVLFQSVAENAGRKAVGIILTGMGSDGAKGLLAMPSRGRIPLDKIRTPALFTVCPWKPIIWVQWFVS